jgi:hypothetical protein
MRLGRDGFAGLLYVVPATRFIRASVWRSTAAMRATSLRSPISLVMLLLSAAMLAAIMMLAVQRQSDEAFQENQTR